MRSRSIPGLSGGNLNRQRVGHISYLLRRGVGVLVHAQVERFQRAPLFLGYDGAAVPGIRYPQLILAHQHGHRRRAREGRFLRLIWSVRFGSVSFRCFWVKSRVQFFFFW